MTLPNYIDVCARGMIGSAPLFFLLPSTAHAHWGHVADVAGHGHWIAIAATLGAAALAGLLIKDRVKDEKPSVEDKEEAEENSVDDTQPEAA